MLSLAVSDLTKILTEALAVRTKRRDFTRAQLLEFLEEIAKEARSLADTWTRLLGEISSTGYANREPSLPILKATDTVQHRIFTKLAVFYEGASRVLGGRLDVEWRSAIFDRLAGLIYARNITRERYDAFIARLDSPILLCGENGQNSWNDIESAVLTLNKEAAALEALVVMYKASPST